MRNIYKNILSLSIIIVIILIIVMSVLNQPGNKIGDAKIGEKENETGTSIYSHTITDGELMLINNIWGATEKEKNNNTLKSYIYLKTNGNFGWEWSRPSSNLMVPPIYPEVIIGASPGSNYSTTKLFPIRYGDIDNWTSEVEFQYVKKPEGHYNFAYDVYLVNKTNNVKFNFMIWISGQIDDAEYVTDISDGTNKYGFYRRRPSGNANLYWHAFILNNQGGSKFKVNIKELLNHIPGENINDDWSVLGIELGNEIYSGSGRIEINKYVTNLNGQVINSSNLTN